MSNDSKMVRFFTMEQFNNKRGVGSTKLRVHNLIKYWEGAGLYKYGEKPDVLIFQKVFCTYDYKFPMHYKDGIKILDVCDPEWTNTPDIYIKETLDAMDATVVPTEPLRKLLQQMTDKPVRVIKDRFDLSEFPAPRQHRGRAKTAVWFGYIQNAELLKFALPSLESRGIELIVISNEDPAAYRWAENPDEYQKKYTYIKYDQETVYECIQAADVCVLPKGYRPEDRFKSENKTIIAQLCGLPVVSDAEELDKLLDAESRNKHIANVYDKIKEEYDCRKSVSEYKELIDEVTNS